MSKSAGRLQRLFERLQRQVPAAAGILGWLRQPRVAWVRIPVGILLCLGGIFSFLPVLGIWMLPLGLLLLAVDIPLLQTPVSGAILRVQRRWSLWSRNRRQKKLDAQNAKSGQ
jgi:hypothetical protein